MRNWLIGCVLLLVAGPTTAPAENPLAQLPKADEVFYHFMPIAWRDGDPDPDNFGDFDGMTDSLDYLDGLGITAVWMNPVFDSPAYHGYQHGKGNVLNPRFGDESQFTSFLSSANARGIEVYLDFVCYGVSRQVPWFLSAYGNPGSQYDDWFAFTDSANLNYQGNTFPTWNGDTVTFVHWDLRTQEPRDKVIRWGRKWLDPDMDGDFSDGVSGYRLDHVWVNYPSGPFGWGYNLDSFWTEWHAALRETRPDLFTFAEQADWGSYGGEFLGVFGGAMTKPFEFAARDALRSEQAAGLYNAMGATVAALPDEGTFVAIIGDHDIDRLASNINADTPATSGRARAAAAVLLLQPFPPIIYYGDEIGMLGRKGDYGGDQNDIPMREPFKWNAVFGAPMSRYHFLNTQAFQNRYARNNDGRSVEEQEGVPGSLLETYRELIARRHAHVALRRGNYVAVPSSSSRVWAFHRRYEQGDAPRPDATETIVVAINLSGQSVTTSLDLSAFQPDSDIPAFELVTQSSLPDVTADNAGGYSLTIPAYGYRLLAADLRVPDPTPTDIDGRALDAAFTRQDERATQTAAPRPAGNLLRLSAGHAAAGLRIGIEGDLPGDATALALWIDSKNGGQSVLDLAGLSPPPAGLDDLDGTRFDADFRPDRMLFVNLVGGTLYADDLLLQASGTTKTYLGNVGLNSGSGILGGGAGNPTGIEIAIATDAGPLGGATGLEVLLPWAALQQAPPYCGQVRLLAALVETSGVVTEQVLPPVPAAPGLAPDFETIPGGQWVAAPVLSGADIDADGRVTWDDLDAYYADPRDLDGDGQVTVADEDCLLAYLRRGTASVAQTLQCLAGPDVFLADDCGAEDPDADFDVDLHDVLVLQGAVGG